MSHGQVRVVSQKGCTEGEQLLPLFPLCCCRPLSIVLSPGIMDTVLRCTAGYYGMHRDVLTVVDYGMERCTDCSLLWYVEMY